MKLGTLIFSLQETHRRGVTNERSIKGDDGNWIVRIYDDGDQMNLQLVKCRLRSTEPEFVLLSCPSWWRYSYAAEIFERAIELWENGNGKETSEWF